VPPATVCPSEVDDAQIEVSYGIIRRVWPAAAGVDHNAQEDPRFQSSHRHHANQIVGAGPRRYWPKRS